MATDRGRIKRHIRPLIGNLKVKAFTKLDAENFMNDVLNGKMAGDIKTRPRGVARVKGGPGAAARTLGLLGGIFTFAMKQELRSDNPIHGVEKPKDKKRERFLSKGEFTRLGRVLNLADSFGVNSTAVDVVRLLLHTGCRKSEILKLRWSEVDLERKLLFLSDTKTGARKVYLSDAAIVLIRQQKQIDKNPYVFPGSSSSGHFDVLWTAWDRIRRAAEIEDVRIHDLRHSFASALAEDGQSLFVIGQLLGHKDLRTTQIYAHLTDEAQRDAIEGVGTSLSKVLKTSDQG